MSVPKTPSPPIDEDVREGKAIIIHVEIPTEPSSTEVIRDKHGHLLRGPRPPRLGYDGATCLRCGRVFQTPVEDYAREECTPGGLADKLWLDDARKVPPGYNLHAQTAEEAIAYLASHIVWHCSLDHDLATEHYAAGTLIDNRAYGEPARPWDRSTLKVKTGYAVLEWMKEHDSWVPEIQVHSLSSGADDMMMFLARHAPEARHLPLPGDRTHQHRFRAFLRADRGRHNARVVVRKSGGRPDEQRRTLASSAWPLRHALRGYGFDRTVIRA